MQKLGNWELNVALLVQLVLELKKVGEYLVEGRALPPYKVSKFFQLRGARPNKLDAVFEFLKQEEVIAQCLVIELHLLEHETIRIVERLKDFFGMFL